MSHNHDHKLQCFNKAFAIAASANLIFTIIEARYAIFAHSMSLLADAGHNLGDVLGLLFAWLANWLMTRKSTAHYSYGFKKTTILATILNALILVSTSSIIAYESIIRLIHPAPVQESIIMVIASIGIIVNGSTALLFIRGQKNDLNIKGTFLHLMFDSLISAGVVITGLIILSTRWYYLDPIVGIGIVVIIMLGTWRLLIDSINMILDAVPRGIDQVGIRNYLERLPEVISIHDLHIWALSTNETALTCHIITTKQNYNNSLYDKIMSHLADNFKICHVTLQIETNIEKCSQECLI